MSSTKKTGTTEGTKTTRFEQILEAFSGKRVLIVGDVGIDKYVSGTVERISPEAPVPILRSQSVVLKLGLAANVADNVKALGGIPHLVGVIGSDQEGLEFKKLMKKEGISTSGIVTDVKRKTTTKERVVSDRQQLMRIDYEDVHPVPSTLESACSTLVLGFVKKSDAVIIEDYAKGLISKKLVTTVVSSAGKRNLEVFADPNARTSLSVYKAVTVLRPNIHEAEALSGLSSKSSTFLEDASRVIYKDSGVKHLLVTRGKDGMSICKKDGSCTHIPTIAREVFDVSGAGDTVMAVLALARASGATLEESAYLANIAAGIEVGKRGTATVSVSEIRDALKELS